MAATRLDTPTHRQENHVNPAELDRLARRVGIPIPQPEPEGDQ